MPVILLYYDCYTVILWLLYCYIHLEMNYDRYKFVVQVVIGEQKGEGVKWVECKILLAIFK